MNWKGYCHSFTFMLEGHAKKFPSCVVEKTSKITGKSTHPKEFGKLWTFGWWDPEVTPKILKADIIRNIIITQRQGKSTRIAPDRSEEEKKNWTWDKIEHEERLENKKKTWQEIVESPWSAEATEEPLGVGGCHLKTPARHQRTSSADFLMERAPRTARTPHCPQIQKETLQGMVKPILLFF